MNLIIMAHNLKDKNLVGPFNHHKSSCISFSENSILLMGINLKNPN